jgi:hypothetical protein
MWRELKDRPFRKMSCNISIAISTANFLLQMEQLLNKHRPIYSQAETHVLYVYYPVNRKMYRS